MALTRETEPASAGVWLRKHLAGAISCAVGIVALAVACAMQFGGERAITDTPDVRVTVPLLAVALAAGIYSLARREGAPVLPICGIAMAAAGVVLGYVLLVLAVALVAGLVLVIVSQMT